MPYARYPVNPLGVNVITRCDRPSYVFVRVLQDCITSAPTRVACVECLCVDGVSVASHHAVCAPLHSRRGQLTPCTAHIRHFNVIVAACAVHIQLLFMCCALYFAASGHCIGMRRSCCLGWGWGVGLGFRA